MRHQTLHPDQRVDLMAKEFETFFGGQPELWSQAPGRVDLMGSHTDYNQGFVLTQAIGLNTWIAARRRSDRQVVVKSLNLPGTATLDLENIKRELTVPWANYVFGVASTLQQVGYQLSGFDGLVHSTVPAGAGLSSSAALEVAAAVLFNRLGGLGIPPVSLARYCQRAENEFVGLNCGILDQYSSLMGKNGCSLLLDCRRLSSVAHPIAEEISIMICDTRTPRELTGSEYSERRKQCEQGVSVVAGYHQGVEALRDVDLGMLSNCEPYLDETVFRRCKFVIEENDRVAKMARALATGDNPLTKRLAEASYRGARDLYGISVPNMERMTEAMARGAGFIGGRQAGAGFGGCMVAFVRAGYQEQFSEKVSEVYTASSGIEPAIYEVRPAAGAGIFDPEQERRQ